MTAKALESFAVGIEHLVYVAAEDSWGIPLDRRQAADVFGWIGDYSQRWQEKVGVVDLGVETRFIWGKRRQDLQANAG